MNTARERAEQAEKERRIRTLERLITREALGLTRFTTLEEAGFLLGMCRSQMAVLRKNDQLVTKSVGKKKYITISSINNLVMGEEGRVEPATREHA